MTMQIRDVEILTPDPVDETRTVSVIVRDAETLIELSRSYFERGWRVTSPAPSVFRFDPPAGLAP